MDDLRKCCEAIGICGEPSITVALRKASEEITAGDLHLREDAGYGGVSSDHTLYEACWESAHCGHRMYFKFSLFEDRVIVVRFHVSTVVPMAGKHKGGTR